MQNQQPYSFTQQPVGVRTKRKRKKYRDPFSKSGRVGNLMWDRRIIRGSTYASTVLRLTEEEKELLKRKKKRAPRPVMQAEMEKEEEVEFDEVPPVEGRQHIEIQTDEFIEEITDRPIETDTMTQTDPFMDRPESPLFIPAKDGVDKETQIEEDLFNFDFEVEPILQILVGKTLEQSMLEVMQEEEMKNLKEQQLKFEQKRNTELSETQRLEAEERRKFEEKERRKKQERERLNKEQFTKQKLSSKLFAKEFLRNLEEKVIFKLESEGYFYDVVQRTVEKKFVPFLMGDVNKNLENKKKAASILDGLIMSIL